MDPHYVQRVRANVRLTLPRREHHRADGAEVRQEVGAVVRRPRPVLGRRRSHSGQSKPPFAPPNPVGENLTNRRFDWECARGAAKTAPPFPICMQIAQATA